MLSRLLPRANVGAAADEVEAFVFNRIGLGAHAGSSPAQRGDRTDAPSEQELHLLRLKMAEMERVLPKQIADAKRIGALEVETAARLKAENAIKPVLDQLAAAIDILVAVRARSRKELEAEAVKLALAVAQRILRRELSVDSCALEALIAGAYDKVSRQEIIRVIVDPFLAAPVKEALAKLSTRQIELVVDPARERGTLVFETVRGTLDASIESQFREIELGLADRIKSR